MKCSKRLLAPLLLAAMPGHTSLWGAPPAETGDLSLASLMQLNIGTITGMSARKVPVALTVISQEQIRSAPARTVLDLMETYVPGMMWIHSNPNSPQPAIRGVSSDRATKILLLVNGRMVNEYAAAGAVSELNAWNLEDIERIEVIRGPGSVTYGPGATMGVVNIITKTDLKERLIAAGVTHATEYDNGSAWVQLGMTGSNFQGFIHGSVGTKEGTLINRLSVSQTAVGDKTFAEPNPEAPYYRSYKGSDGDQLDFKVHAQAQYGDFKLWSRLTGDGWINQDTYLPIWDDSAAYADSLGRRLTDYDNYFFQSRVFQSVTDFGHEKEWNSWLKTQAHLYYSSTAWEVFRPNNQVKIGSATPRVDRYHPTNSVALFSLNAMGGSLITNFTATDWLKMALGTEQYQSSIGSFWGRPSNSIRIGDQGRILSDSSSRAYNMTTKKIINPSSVGYFVGDGWSSWHQAYLGEINADLHQYATLLLSGRVDHETGAEWAFSPRLALVSELGAENYLKVVWQKSVRLPALQEIKMIELVNADTLASTPQQGAPVPEVMTGTEVMWSWYPSEKMSMSASAFYNNYEFLGWNNAKSGITPLGEAQTYGGDLEVGYKAESWSVGLNHSFTKLLEFTRDAQAAKVQVSASDMDDSIWVGSGKTKLTYRLDSEGNDLLNWNNHISKAFGSWSPWKWMTLHTDMRVFWGMQGELDLMEAYRNANFYVSGGPDTVHAKTQDSLLQIYEDEGVFGVKFTMGASVEVRPVQWVSVQVGVQNIFDDFQRNVYNNNIGTSRYYGNAAQEEPRTVFTKISATF